MNIKATIFTTLAVTLCCTAHANEVKDLKSIVPDETGSIIASYSRTAPTIDGKTDALWSQSNALNVEVVRVLEPDIGAKANVTIRSMYTKTHVYFNVSWADDTQSVSHKTWRWDKNNNKYEEGEDREDMFSLAFEKEGKFNVDMLSATAQIWDVWHWKAYRTNVQGYAMDKQHIYTNDKPAGKVRPYMSRNGKTIWIARPEDKGASSEKKQPAPEKYSGDKVAQYVATIPHGSSVDVKAKGVWKDGRWTLEFSCKLNTLHADDTAFDTGKRYAVGLASFDHTGDMDKASAQLKLVFK